MTISLARRYRPKRFSDLLVQDHVAAVLRGAVARDRIGHGYLLTGPRGVGKTTAARILAMALNCPNRTADGDPCGECESCERIWSGGASLDVVEIDAASNRGVDDARDLRERAMYAPSEESHYKVYIVDEAHMLTREAWNALLKVLEEPPPRVVFVFATTEPQKIFNTAAPVLSRLQRFDFRRIGPAAIRDRLRAVLDAEGIRADDDALALIARHADGGMRDALSVLDQCLSLGEGEVTAARVRETLGLASDELLADLLGLIAERDAAGVFRLVDALLESGADLGEFLLAAGEMLRAMLLLKVGGTPEGLTEAVRAVLDRNLDALSAGDLLRMLKLLADQEASLRRSANPRLVTETLLLRWVMLDRTVDLEQVIAGGQGGRAGDQEGKGDRAGVQAVKAVAPRPVKLSAMLQDGQAAEPPGRRAAEPSQLSAPFTLTGAQSIWPSAMETVREQSRFLGEALAGTRIVEVEAPLVRIELPEANPMNHENIERQARVVETVLAAALGAPVRLKVQGPGNAGDAPRPRPITEASARADRLSGLRQRDPALDAAATELDLEIVD
ncbi:MAG TPA: DNA polymerase III subunit gamma/tau [Gemmatimonadales bacterium]|nr:DNA polymerase III subunit gamma/tau [Gemmatimonadales bacterium]